MIYIKLDKILGINKNDLKKILNERSTDYDKEQKFKQEFKEILIKRTKNLKCQNSMIRNKIMLVSNMYGLSKIKKHYYQECSSCEVCKNIVKIKK